MIDKNWLNRNWSREKRSENFLTLSDYDEKIPREVMSHFFEQDCAISSVAGRREKEEEEEEGGER